MTKNNSSHFQEILDSLNILKDDQDVSKRFKEKTERVIDILVCNEPLAAEKALLELEELHSLDISSYHRTQVWDIISMLESLKN